MRISASVHSSPDHHDAMLTTDGRSQSLDLPGRATGPGVGINGGEMLFLALATCYCNDIYREADKRGIEVIEVEVTVEGTFEGVGQPTTHISYHTRIVANATEDQIRHLAVHTDSVAEIQKTLRHGARVVLNRVDAIEAS